MTNIAPVNTNTTEATFKPLASPALRMKGKASATFNTGTKAGADTFKGTEAEAFKALKGYTKVWQLADGREASARVAKAKALADTYRSGVFFTIVKPEDRTKGTTAWSVYYTKVLGTTEGKVTGPLNWGMVMADLGHEVSPSVGAALAPVPSADRAKVYAKAAEAGGKVTRDRVNAARHALGIAPPATKPKGRAAELAKAKAEAAEGKAEGTKAAPAAGRTEADAAMMAADLAPTAAIMAAAAALRIATEAWKVADGMTKAEAGSLRTLGKALAIMADAADNDRVKGTKATKATTK